jgi:pimeloyl-ACP methyl ester carboxylesterase
MRSTSTRTIATTLLAASAATSAWIGFRYRRDIDHARRRVAAGSKVIATPCGSIECAERGSGPPILAIHGAGGGFDQGLLLAGPLASGHRVIAMSRFGYLRTPAPAHPSIVLQAQAHACLLDALDLQDVAVIAWSAGAPSALEFALKYPERCKALVLFVPGWFPPERRNLKRLGPVETIVFNRLLRSDFFFWALARFMPSLSDRTLLGTPATVVAAASPSDQARVAALLRQISPISERHIGLSLEGRLTTGDLSDSLESMAVPTLVISAEDDLYGTYANAQFIANHVPHAQFIGYRTGGHMLVGHNDEVVSSVHAFLHNHGADLESQ